jgi:hypothetical protein
MNLVFWGEKVMDPEPVVLGMAWPVGGRKTGNPTIGILSLARILAYRTIRLIIYIGHSDPHVFSDADKV